MEEQISFLGIVGVPELDYSTLAASRRAHQLTNITHRRTVHQEQLGSISEHTVLSAKTDELPPFIRILNILFTNTKTSSSDTGTKSFITNVGALHDTAFSPKCPILGTGHHFVVYASPFEASDRDFTTVDGRASNPEVYCFKTPNFISGANASTKEAFREEYYHTTLQELRVLLHPQLRNCENVISLFGLDFQEDYDDYTVAWPVLVMEYAEYGTLDTLQEDIRLDTELARILLLDTAQGIQALHQCNIIHGDVKSENVLICRHHQRRYIARLADFGLSLINADVESSNHRLPGGTFLWSAPEIDDFLSVQGLRQTDVFSFGLLVWRVLVHNPNPYRLIPPAALDLQTIGTLNQTVTRAKSHERLVQLVLQTIEMQGATQIYFRQTIEATLGKDPPSRDLDRVISVLDLGKENRLSMSEPVETYWILEEPSLVLEELDDVYQERLVPLLYKPSVLHSLATSMERVFNSSSDLACHSGWFLFRFASSVQFQVLRKDVDECCRILIRLCHLSSALSQAIFARYHQLCNKKPKVLDLHWLEVAASNGSYYAMDSLRTSYPDKYAQLMRSPLNFELNSGLEGKELSLLDYCRQGDYAGCKMMLNTGAPAYPLQDGTVSVLHWLVSFQDENHVNELVGLILGKGGFLHAWEGEESDFAFGRVVGTPLHWAIWHRNIPLVRALTREDHWPETKHVDRAIFVAAAMHFYDVLEVLKGWVFNLKNSTPSMYDWHSALMAAAESSELWLPRRLRHGDDNLPRALEHTMDIILSATRPSENDVKTISLFARFQNNATLLRYLFNRLDLGNRKDLLTDQRNHLAFQSMAMGFVEIFEICIEKRILTPQTEHAEQKWKPLQLCCLVRQRDQVFARRLIEIGCPVDSVGETEETHWSPFFIAVSLGMYHIAVILLEHGADKDFLSGWLGGITGTMNLLQNWPDIPVSRLKFLLEEVPRLGFGHVAFWSWPGAGGNLLYALSFSHWSSYTAGFRLGETAKYILSQLANKTCLNIIDKVGGTALRMACASGNLEICQALIEAGQDVNLSMGFSPLKNAKEWMIKCQKRENVANTNRGRSGNERRLAKMLRIRAEQTVALLVSNGAIDRGFVESLNNTRDFVSSGQWQRPSFETLLEMLSGLVDRSPLVEAGSTPLQPTSREDFRVHHGRPGNIQLWLRRLGQRMDQPNRQYMRAVPRYQPHNCDPWGSNFCVPHLATTEHTPGARWQPAVPGLTLPINPLHIQHFSIAPSRPMDPGPSQRQYIAPSAPQTAQGLAATPSPQSSRTVEEVENKIRDQLLLYFLERGGKEADEKRRREEAARILQKQLEEAIILSAPYHDIGECWEFTRFEIVVKRCLETMCVDGLMLVPELSNEGLKLVIHVFLSSVG